MVRLNTSEVTVVHVIGAFVAGGAEKFVWHLCAGLARAGVNVAVAALSHRVDLVGDAMIRELEERGVMIGRGPTDKVGFKSMLWYRRWLRSVRPSIVHLHTENTELAQYIAQPLLEFRPTLVRTMHTVNRSANRLHWLAIHGNRVATSIACGPAVRTRFFSELKGKLICIPNGVKFDWPIQDDETKQVNKRQLGLADGKLDFVHVGNQKGNSLEGAPKAHDVLLRAWAMAGMGERGCRLHLIGDGELREQLEALAGSDNSIRFHGVRADVTKWLLASDWYVMPSRYEGLPIAAIEAVGTGLPCIFSDIDPLLDFADPSVLRVKTGDVNDLAAKLIVASAQPRVCSQQLACRERERHGIDGVVQRYIEVYASAMGGSEGLFSSAAAT